ncbi:hypothetical protein RhiirA4_472386 [Rhizophagus irregularis]|uniref:Uncharacterized protein n=1 Tax=Rhizophagus irregularis TaxID=588596 RepID=A0A2I1H4W1_9GLOM|nr:hypothetical protein RhiirA4_472386 [Rhizophagus irregularis]
MSSKNENLHLVLPKLTHKSDSDFLICKMNVKKILSKNCFIKFISNGNYREDCMLKHKDITQLSIEIEINYIEVQIEYIRLGVNPYTITSFPNISLMGYLLPVYHKLYSSVQITFKDKYFSRKELKNLLDLKDILNSL